jgi:hypothetical protein
MRHPRGMHTRAGGTRSFRIRMATKDTSYLPRKAASKKEGVSLKSKSPGASLQPGLLAER